MEFNINNDINLSLKLNINQQMDQSLKILQMNSLDLNNFIDNMAIENPVIEMDELYNNTESFNDLRNKIEWLQSKDNQDLVHTKSTDNKDIVNMIPIFETSENLTAHLIKQLDNLSLTKPDYKICKYIIYSLDNKGYLNTEIKNISKIFGTTSNHILGCLIKIQGFDPYGVAARDLNECLKIQIKINNINDTTLIYMIDNHICEILSNSLDKISSSMGITISEVKKSMDVLKTLNPYPGSAFECTQYISYIEPDIIVTKANNQYTVRVNDFSYPPIKISEYYKKLLNESSDPAVKEYIQKGIHKAIEIKNSIAKRNTTLYNTAIEIINIQKAFFDKGPGNLVPMNLDDIAKKIDVHISTVSRAVVDKYLLCSWGVFELKYFFPHVVNKNKAHITAKKIKNAISDIISAEDKNHPLSDSAIVELLNEKTIKLARRTVAKYRSELEIPSAQIRKKF